jgi:hypothetical protein
MFLLAFPCCREKDTRRYLQTWSTPPVKICFIRHHWILPVDTTLIEFSVKYSFWSEAFTDKTAELTQ